MSSPTCVAARAAALVLRGQAGVGKTALLDHALNTAHGFAVTRAAGVESEVELPYAALHQLCGRMLDRIERLPPPQTDALGVVFGVHVGEPPDRYIVGLATLNLLAEVAADQPLLCVVDDAQWLDQASARTLAFVVRRLGAESIALLFGAREPLGVPDLAGLPELVVGGLSDVDSRALLVSVLPGRVDASVVDRVVAEARESARTARAAARSHPRRSRGRLPHAAIDVAVGPNRGSVLPPLPRVAGANAAAPPSRRRRARRRSGAVVAGGSLARHRRRGCHRCRSRRARAGRHPGGVSTSARSLGDLQRRVDPRPTTSARSAWPTRPTRPTPIDGRGTAPPRHPARTRTSRPTWNARPSVPSTGEASEPRARSWNEPPC